jgi:hypothetical protein
MSESENVSSIPKELESKLREMAIAESKPEIEVKVEEVEELTGELESNKPKAKKERTEAQKAVFEKARLKRQENIAKKKAEKEANKKPRGRPLKEPEPEPELELSSEDETIIEEEIEYRKKPKAKPIVTKKVKKVVYISDDSDEDSSSSDEDFYNQLQAKYGKKQIQQQPQYSYQPPTSMNNFYRFA